MIAELEAMPESPVRREVSNAEFEAFLAEHEGLLRTTAWAWYQRTGWDCSSFDLDDLMQVGRVGILKALQSHEEGRGRSLTSWARQRAYWEMQRLLDTHRTTIAVPKYQARNVRFHRVSLSQPIFEGSEETLMDRLEAPRAPESPEEDVMEVLHAALDKLPEKMRLVMRQRFLEGKSLQVVGDGMGRTKERVRQLESLAIDRLRKFPELKEIWNATLSA